MQYWSTRRTANKARQCSWDLKWRNRLLLNCRSPLMPTGLASKRLRVVTCVFVCAPLVSCCGSPVLMTRCSLALASMETDSGCPSCWSSSTMVACACSKATLTSLYHSLSSCCEADPCAMRTARASVMDRGVSISPFLKTCCCCQAAAFSAAMAVTAACWLGTWSWNLDRTSRFPDTRCTISRRLMDGHASSSRLCAMLNTAMSAECCGDDQINTEVKASVNAHSCAKQGEDFGRARASKNVKGIFLHGPAGKSGWLLKWAFSRWLGLVY